MTATPTRSEISFRFRGKTVSLKSFPPDRTLLDWLREDKGRRGRRKAAPRAIAAPARWCWRGCAAAQLVYEPVNACILLLGQLDGAELITVEDLAAGRARCIRCSRRWSITTARNAASARRAS